MKCIFHFILNSSYMITTKFWNVKSIYHNLMTHQGWNAFEISLSSDLLWMQWDELRAQWEKSPIQCHGESQDKKFCIYYALSMYMLIHKMLFIYIYIYVFHLFVFYIQRANYKEIDHGIYNYTPNLLYLYKFREQLIHVVDKYEYRNMQTTDIGMKYK